MRRLLLLAIIAAVLGAPSAASAADRDCGDFATQASAQSYFDSSGYTGSNDPEQLDADGDGVACESNPCPCGNPGQVTPPPPKPACSDGTDNDGDTHADYPADPGCTDANDTDETDPPPAPPTCANGLDDDGDGRADHPTDPGCTDASDTDETDPAPAVKAKTFTARLIQIVDGDTVRVRRPNGTKHSVRLLGIDTPETKKPGVPVECGGKQATALITKVGLGTIVTVTTDPTQDQRDRYGRLLAYITVTTTKTDLAVRLLRAGWADSYIYDNTPVQRHPKYQVAADNARTAGRGVHRACGGDFHSAQ